MKTADLHLHSLFSDGTYTPQELVIEAKKCGLSAISLADHDSVEGIADAIEAGKQNNIEVLPGIELTAEYNNLEVHILGYLVDYKNKPLKAQLDSLRKIRIDRIYKIVEKLKKIGLNLSEKAVFDLSKGGTVGRLHVARAMVLEGLVSSFSEAFQKYLGENCPAYVLGFKLSPEGAIKLIKDVGGIPVLAHPYTLHSDELIVKFIELGIMGLEALYFQHSPEMTAYYVELAKKYDLVVTGGSDFHGDAKIDVKMGSFRIPYELVEKLKLRKK